VKYYINKFIRTFNLLFKVFLRQKDTLLVVTGLWSGRK